MLDHMLDILQRIQINQDEHLKEEKFLYDQMNMNLILTTIVEESSFLVLYSMLQQWF
jgi:hypothetical protein